MCPLGDRIGDDSVDADSGQEKRDTGEGDEKEHMKRQRSRASESSSRIILTSAIGCSVSTCSMASASSLSRLPESGFVRTAQRIGIVPTNKEAKCVEIW